MDDERNQNHIWATEDEAAISFQAIMDAAWEEWWQEVSISWPFDYTPEEVSNEPDQPQEGR